MIFYLTPPAMRRPTEKKHYRHHHLELCSWFSIIPRLILRHLRRYAKAKKALRIQVAALLGLRQRSVKMPF